MFDDLTLQGRVFQTGSVHSIRKRSPSLTKQVCAHRGMTKNGNTNVHKKTIAGRYQQAHYSTTLTFTIIKFHSLKKERGFSENFGLVIFIAIMEFSSQSTDPEREVQIIIAAVCTCMLSDLHNLSNFILHLSASPLLVLPIIHYDIL